LRAQENFARVLAGVSFERLAVCISGAGHDDATRCGDEVPASVTGTGSFGIVTGFTELVQLRTPTLPRSFSDGLSASRLRER